MAKTKLQKTYLVNEIFGSIQGEGANAGRAATFVRFAGCNLACVRETHGFDCDTEFTSGRRMTAHQIALACGDIGNRLVIFTGGEPLLQVDTALLTIMGPAARTLNRSMKVPAQGFERAVETNGSQALGERLDLFEWVACSPKVAEHAVRLERADELRYVRGAGQGVPRPSLPASRLFVSPAFIGDQPDPQAIQTCLQIVTENPEWTLSLQLHKLIHVR